MSYQLMHFFDKPHLATLKNLILYQGRAGTTITCVKLAEVVAKVGRCEKKVLVKHFLHNRKEKKNPRSLTVHEVQRSDKRLKGRGKLACDLSRVLVNYS